MMVSAGGLRVYIRPVELGDRTAIASNANDERVSGSVSVAGTFPHPYTETDASAFIESAANTLVNGTGFHFAICLAETGELIGVCGIKDVDHVKLGCEIGYWLGSRHWGRGYATEAVMLLLHVAFDRLNMSIVTARTLSSNGRSLGLLDRLGFRRVDTYTEEAKDSTVSAEVLRLTADEYRSGGAASLQWL